MCFLSKIAIFINSFILCLISLPLVITDLFVPNNRLQFGIPTIKFPRSFSQSWLLTFSYREKIPVGNWRSSFKLRREGYLILLVIFVSTLQMKELLLLAVLWIYWFVLWIRLLLLRKLKYLSIIFVSVCETKSIVPFD